MTQVMTIEGLVDRDKLTGCAVVTEDDSNVCVAIEWKLNGKQVRRDVWINSKRGLSVSATTGNVNG